MLLVLGCVRFSRVSLTRFSTWPFLKSLRQDADKDTVTVTRGRKGGGERKMPTR